MHGMGQELHPPGGPNANSRSNSNGSYRPVRYVKPARVLLVAPSNRRHDDGGDSGSDEDGGRGDVPCSTRSKQVGSGRWQSHLLLPLTGLTLLADALELMLLPFLTLGVECEYCPSDGATTSFSEPSQAQSTAADRASECIESSLLSTSVFVGMLVGALLSGLLADHFGRPPRSAHCVIPAPASCSSAPSLSLPLPTRLSRPSHRHPIPAALSFSPPSATPLHCHSACCAQPHTTLPPLPSPAAMRAASRRSSPSAASAAAAAGSGRAPPSNASALIESLAAEQNGYLLLLLEKEQANEVERGRLLASVDDPADARRLEKIFAVERAKAAAALKAVTRAHEQALARKMQQLGVIEDEEDDPFMQPQPHEVQQQRR